MCCPINSLNNSVIPTGAKRSGVEGLCVYSGLAESNQQINLTINGQTQSHPAETLGALVEALGMKPDRVAIELNREIVPANNGRKRPCTKETGSR